MFPSLSAVTISIFFALSTNASPLAQAAPSPAKDACGPQVSVPGDPRDSCHTKPPTLDIGSPAAAFAMNPIPYTTGNPNYYRWGTQCAPLVDQICTNMFASNFTANVWFFQTTPFTTTWATNTGKASPCQLGYFVPLGAGSASRPGTVTETGQAFNTTDPMSQCKQIYNAMIQAADQQTPIQPEWTGVSINLAVNPAMADGQFPLPNGSGTGRSTFAKVSEI